MANVFISYSHKDRAWADRLLTHVRSPASDVRIDVWGDERIGPGIAWHEEIRQALAHADVAVPLVSQSFLASEAISTHVLQPLFAKAAAGRVTIRPLIIERSPFAATSAISNFQPLNSPNQALTTLSRARQEEVLIKVSRDVMRLAALSWADQTSVQLPMTMKAADHILSADPLAAARQRGADARQEILVRQGGMLTGDDVAGRLGLTERAVEARRRVGQLIGLEVSGEYAYPAWQITDKGLLPGLETALSHLQTRDPWMQAAFFVSRDPRLDGETPLAELRRGNVAAVRRAARAYGEHGAA